MNTASIFIKTDPHIKAKAQEIASNMGVSLTSVVNRYLKHFITTKEITYSNEDKPTKYLIESLRKSDEDIKAGRVISFNSGKDALAYLDHEIENEKRPKAKS